MSKAEKNFGFQINIYLQTIYCEVEVMKIRIIKEVISKSGDKWAVKSKKGKTLGTHDSETKAKAQLAAIEASKNEEQLEEISSVGSGAVQGYGAPLGSKKDNEEFNESEKQASKLKGKKLAEMFSSSTQTGGLRISIVRGEKEHAGHVERARHQGLRNVMKEDDDATLPMDDSTRPLPDAKPIPVPRDPVEVMLEKNGYKLKKKLGEGQYGVVVLATEIDEYGGHNFAIKILKKTGGEAIAREVRNYREISSARDKNPVIAKHFPEVFKIFEEEGNTFIVMEVLEPLHAELKGIFSGVEQIMHKQRPMMAPNWPISQFDSDKDVSKRVEMMLDDSKQIANLIDVVKRRLLTYSTEYNKKIEPQVLKDIETAINPSVFANFRSVSRKEASQKVNRFNDQILDYLGGAAGIYSSIMTDMKNSPASQVFVTLMCKKIIEIMKRYTPQGDNVKDFTEFIVKPFLERFQKQYRMSTSLKGGYSQSDIGKEGGRRDDAESIFQAIMGLQKETGLFARDLHDGNAMRRPDGDIVIVDVGMFKTDTELNQMKKGKLRENRIRIKIKR